MILTFSNAATVEAWSGWASGIEWQAEQLAERLQDTEWFVGAAARDVLASLPGAATAAHELLINDALTRY